MMKRIGILMIGLVAVVVGVGGCGDGDKEETIAGPQGQNESGIAPAESEPLGRESSELVPDIALEDVNPSSPFFATEVSPRRFLGQVSAWYFGHAT